MYEESQESLHKDLFPLMFVLEGWSFVTSVGARLLAPWLKIVVPMMEQATKSLQLVQDMVDLDLEDEDGR